MEKEELKLEYKTLMNRIIEEINQGDRFRYVLVKIEQIDYQKKTIDFVVCVHPYIRLGDEDINHFHINKNFISFGDHRVTTQGSFPWITEAVCRTFDKEEIQEIIEKFGKKYFEQVENLKKIVVNNDFYDPDLK